MPIRWNIDEDMRVTTVTVTGSLTLDGAQQTISELHQQPSYRPPMADLWDMREGQLDAGPGEVAAFVRFIQARRGEGGERGTDRTALLVTGGVELGISRMYQSHAEGMMPFQVRVFTTLEAARSWLERRPA